MLPAVRIFGFDFTAPGEGSLFVAEEFALQQVRRIAAQFTFKERCRWARGAISCRMLFAMEFVSLPVPLSPRIE